MKTKTIQQGLPLANSTSSTSTKRGNVFQKKDLRADSNDILKTKIRSDLQSGHSDSESLMETNKLIVNSLGQ